MQTQSDRNGERERLLQRVGNAAQLGSIRESVLQGGKATGVRSLVVQTGSGLSFTVLPDRFLDIADATFNGASLCWHSPTGVVHPAYYDPAGLGWLWGFGGGLLTTCGLTQVGSPNVFEGESLGIHGRAAHIPAENVSHESVWIENRLTFIVRGTMREARLFGPNLRCTREIRTELYSNRITIRDIVTNDGFETSPLMVLYHCNLGFPLLDEGAEVLINTAHVEPRDETALQGLHEWSAVGPPMPGWQEQVFIHDVRADALGWGAAALVNRRFRSNAGIGLMLRWRTAELPELMQWKMLGQGAYVMGLEPANCQVLGRSAEAAAGRLQYIAPGERLEFALDLEVLPDATAIAAVLPHLKPSTN